MTSAPPVDAIRAAFARFVPIAARGLRQMVTDDGRWFCFKATAGPDGLTLAGHSARYSAMSLIGLSKAAAILGASADGTPNIDTGPIADSLHAFAPQADHLGDAGLVLWSETLRGDERAEETANVILQRRDEFFQPKFDRASMENGFLLIGIAEAMKEGIGGLDLSSFAADVAANLARNQHPETDLFSFSRWLQRKNVHRARIDYRLGSFASQVYPIMGFSAFARASGGDRALGNATRCADRLVDLQGPEGQWWWVYICHRGEPAVRYPVYAVHQDAMGPMALLAASLADDNSSRFDPSIARSFSWFESRPECPDAELVDSDRGVVWRAVQHDEPTETGQLGLGRSELSRIGRAAWFGIADRRPLAGGFACMECRPYHLGWILLAAGLFEERTAAEHSAP